MSAPLSQNKPFHALRQGFDHLFCHNEPLTALMPFKSIEDLMKKKRGCTIFHLLHVLQKEHNTRYPKIPKFQFVILY